MSGTGRADADAHPVDGQVVRKGKLSDGEKPDIAFEGSMATSEPP